MQVSFPAAGQSVLTVSGLNKLDELRNEQRSQVFENMTDSAIPRQVVAPLDLDLRTDPSADAREAPHEFVFPHNQYDLLFLNDRPRRLGYQLVVVDTPARHPRPHFGTADRIPPRPPYPLTHVRTLI